jgi:AcrR family transcriptional regulator
LTSTVAELTVERIAAASLRVVDERGASGFTMRAVAERLGVTPMAIYHHVGDKAGLVALLVDEVIRGRALPTPTGAWRDDLWELAHWSREVTRAHPAVGKLRNDYDVWTPSIFPMTERWLSVWQQSGLDLDAAMFAAAASSTAIIGFVEQELIQDATTPPTDAVLASFPNARFAFSVKRDGAKEFEQVVRALIEGLHESLADGDGRRSKPRGRRRV